MDFYPIHFDQLQSTNSHSIDLIAKSNPIEGTVISTYNQVSGTGQIGRKWFSDIDKNITSSIIIYPHFLPIDKLFYINIVLSLAIRTTIQSIVDKEVKIKWPNDIYIENYKIAGLLIQQSIQGKVIKSSVLGFGINVNQIVFPDYLPNPISIFNITNQGCNLDQFQKMILKQFDLYYTKLRNGDYIELKKEYLIHLYGRGEMHKFTTNEEKFEAEILGVDAQGKLTLNKNNQIKSFGLNQISINIPYIN